MAASVTVQYLATRANVRLETGKEYSIDNTDPVVQAVARFLRQSGSPKVLRGTVTITAA